MNLSFYKFHNYLDRVIEYHKGYEAYNSALITTFTDIDFNLLDGVNNTGVVIDDDTGALNAYHSNYVIAWYTDSEQKARIHSRWFIMRQTEVSYNKYTFDLRRDVIGDNYQTVINSPVFIEKGFVSAYSSAIFNDEQMTFNQIKKKEYLLKDQTNCPWLAIYYAQKDAEGNLYNLKGSFSYAMAADVILDGEINTWEYYNDCNLTAQTAVPTETVNKQLYSSIELGCIDRFASGEPVGSIYKIYEAQGQEPTFVAEWGESNKTHYYVANPQNNYNSPYGLAQEASKEFQQSFALTEQTKKDIIGSQYSIINQETLSYLYTMNGKVIRSTLSNGSHKYYEIVATTVEGPAYLMKQIDKNTSAYNALDYWCLMHYREYANSNNITFALEGPCQFYTLQLKDITGTYINDVTSTGYQYDTTGHINTQNAAYNVAVIPYVDAGLKFGHLDYVASVRKDLAYRLVQDIASRPETEVYDIQLLPYCPIPDIKQMTTISDTDFVLGLPDWIYSDNKEPYDKLISDENFSWVWNKETESTPYPTPDLVGQIIINVPDCNVHTIVPAPGAESLITDPIERKVAILTKMTRICAPNYNGLFDFNKQKNGGLSEYEIYMTLKPVQPYLHITPKFNVYHSLYGGDYNDYRGMIAGPDFSLSRKSNAWNEYELTNKNYQNIFNRQIQNLEFQNSMANEQAEIQHWLSQFSSSLSNLNNTLLQAAIGSRITPSISAIGGIVNQGLQDYGYKLDKSFRLRGQQEELLYQRDMFGFNLANIKAIPESLSKISSFDVDNKIWPFIEEYGASIEEEEALRKKLKYDGMTIGRISTIREMELEKPSPTTPMFIKGQLIRLLDETDSEVPINTQIEEAIFDEIYKGVRFE